MRLNFFHNFVCLYWNWILGSNYYSTTWGVRDANGALERRLKGAAAGIVTCSLFAGVIVIGVATARRVSNRARNKSRPSAPPPPRRPSDISQDSSQSIENTSSIGTTNSSLRRPFRKSFRIALKKWTRKHPHATTNRDSTEGGTGTTTSPSLGYQNSDLMIFPMALPAPQRPKSNRKSKWLRGWRYFLQRSRPKRFWNDAASTERETDPIIRV
eukprot:c18945_g1_i2.p1 GENE.c18945_g1_i2~~c18945_g1_i2.p1  ORF type:complete len:213 (-),score=23.04 c18945_g1_i2:347-985(-)